MFRIPEGVLNELSVDDDSDVFAEGAASAVQMDRLIRSSKLFHLRDEDIEPDHEMEAAFGNEERMYELQKSK